MQHSRIEQQDIDQWHAVRSRLIDSFAELEGAVVTVLKATGIHKFNGEPLSHKVEMLRGAKPAPQYSKTKRDQVHDLLPQFDRLIEIRNDVVHAKLRLSDIDGQAAAVFLNAKEMDELAPKVRVLTLEHFKQLEKDTRKLSSALLRKSEPVSQVVQSD